MVKAPVSRIGLPFPSNHRTIRHLTKRQTDTSSYLVQSERKYTCPTTSTTKDWKANSNADLEISDHGEALNKRVNFWCNSIVQQYHTSRSGRIEVNVCEWSKWPMSSRDVKSRRFAIECARIREPAWSSSHYPLPPQSDQSSIHACLK